MTVTVFKIVKRKKKAHRSPFQRFHHKMSDIQLQNETEISTDSFFEKNNILPYWVDFKNKVVIFAEVNDSEALSRAPFITDVIYELAEKLYFIPFSLFILLAEKISVLKTEIVLAAFTPRSGSTLVCKLISRIPSYFVMSEPICLNLIERHYSLKSDEGKTLFKSMTLFLSHFAANQGKKGLYIKPFILSNYRIVDSLFDREIKKIVTWRSAFDTMRSLVERRSFIQRKLIKIFKLAVHRKILSFQPKDRKSELRFLFSTNLLSSHHNAIVFSWILPMLHLTSLCKASTVIVFNYNEIINHKADCIKTILNYLNINDDCTDEMMKEFELDSQAGTPMGRDKTYALSDKEKNVMNIEINRFLDLNTINLNLASTLGKP